MNQSNFVSACVGVIAISALFLVYKEVSKEGSLNPKSVPPESAYNEAKQACNNYANEKNKEYLDVNPTGLSVYKAYFENCMEQRGY